MLAYVLTQRGKPLMPCTPAKARKLLEAGKAKVIRRVPFTVKLLLGASGYIQPVTAGMDTGSNVVGTAAIAHGKVLYQSEIQLRQDVSEKMQQRAMYRRTRRGRKTRYRKPAGKTGHLCAVRGGWPRPSAARSSPTCAKGAWWNQYCPLLAGRWKPPASTSISWSIQGWQERVDEMSPGRLYLKARDWIETEEGQDLSEELSSLLTRRYAAEDFKSVLSGGMQNDQ